MSTRIISAAIAIAIAIVIFLLHNTFVFTLAIALVSLCAVYELLKAVKCTDFLVPTLICAAYSFGYFYVDKIDSVYINGYFWQGLFISVLMVTFFKYHEKINYYQMAFMTVVTLLVPMAMSPLVVMNDNYPDLFFVILTLCGAWLADSGAYFAGTFLGKHKLCPSISPKKTIEGLVGGVVTNGVIFLIICLVYDKVIKDDGIAFNYFWIFVAGMVCAVVGLIGDLTASLIKRQCGIKDYGNIMPGHGGVMDRFDSVLFVAPFMYYLLMTGILFN